VRYRQTEDHRRKISESQRKRFARLREAAAVADRLRLLGVVVTEVTE
jgi:hypothetical protein